MNRKSILKVLLMLNDNASRNVECNISLLWQLISLCCFGQTVTSKTSSISMNTTLVFFSSNIKYWISYLLFTNAIWNYIKKPFSLLKHNLEFFCRSQYTVNTISRKR